MFFLERLQSLLALENFVNQFFFIFRQECDACVHASKIENKKPFVQETTL